ALLDLERDITQRLDLGVALAVALRQIGGRDDGGRADRGERHAHLVVLGACGHRSCSFSNWRRGMSVQARRAGARRPRPKGRIAGRPKRWFSAGGSFVRTRRRARTRSSVGGVSGRPAVASLVRSRRSGGDVLLALAVFSAALYSASAYQGAAPALLYALAAVATLPLLVRRLFPVRVLAIVVAATTVVGLGYRGGWWPFAAIVALYPVAAHCPRRTSLRVGAAALVVLAAPIFYRVDWSPLGWNDLALVAERYAPLVAAWLLGAYVRTRREYLRAVEERAAQLEREQEANARRAAAEEQARIAREVHDVVAHNLSVIIVQATAADEVFASDPADAQRAVRTIGSTARRALDELRYVLGASGQQPRLAPQPTLGRLEALLEQVRAAGLEVELEIVGEQ